MEDNTPIWADEDRHVNYWIAIVKAASEAYRRSISGHSNVQPIGEAEAEFIAAAIVRDPLGPRQWNRRETWIYGREQPPALSPEERQRRGAGTLVDQIAAIMEEYHGS